MYYIKDTGFIIRRRNVSEADRYITILTRNNGKIEVLAKGVKKLTSRRAPQLELVNKISFQAVSKTVDARLVLTEVELVSSHTDLKDSLGKIKDLFVICELVLALCPYHQKQEEIFRLLEKSMIDMKKDAIRAIENFQTQLLVVLGYWDQNRAFVNNSDMVRFTENIMERKLQSSGYFKE
jgi:DNA repair protein RecO (recombination protein O)